jgi:hypothetical protein
MQNLLKSKILSSKNNNYNPLFHPKITVTLKVNKSKLNNL